MEQGSDLKLTFVMLRIENLFDRKKSGLREERTEGKMVSSTLSFSPSLPSILEHLDPQRLGSIR